MKRSFQNRTIEVLEDKRMMAANLIGSGMAAMHGAASSVHVSGNTAGSMGAGTVTSGATQTVSGATHLSGLLSGTGQGIVNLVSRTVNGLTSANLGVHVTGAPANATLDVSIGGNVVGSLSTNAHGNGVLHLNTALGNADQLLAALNNLSADATVSIGVAGQTPILTGTLHAGANGGSVSDTVAGLTQAINTLENSVISKLNSIIGSLDSNAGNGGAALGAVTDRINNIVDRLAGIVGRLTPSAVDSALGSMDVSSIVGGVYGLVPSDANSQV
jgi:hypothetical protein